jgi:ABC-type phosphate/phosphonate transport system substrate-binding protein
MQRFVRVWARRWTVFALLGLSASLASAQGLILLVSEGTSGGQDAVIVQGRYEPLAQLIGKAVGAPVRVLVARDFELLAASMADQRADFVVARPSDYPARGVRDHGYQLVATAKPDGQCVFIGPKGAKPWSSIKEAAGKPLALPEERSYMARFCRAELRREGVTPGPIKFHSEQGAVGYAVENGFLPVGGVASYSSVARNWEKNGVVLWKSAPQPYLPLVAKKAVTPQQIAKMREALRAVSADADSPIRKALGITGFDTREDDRLMKLLAFIESR